MNFKSDQRSTRKEGESTKDAFRCRYCQEAFKVRNERPTCAFDGRLRRFHRKHGGCGLMRRMKTAMRVLAKVGTAKRQLRDEERDVSATGYHYICPDGVSVRTSWYKKYDSGNLFNATEVHTDGFDIALHLDRAYKIIEESEKYIESTAMGLTDDQLESIRGAMGIDENEVDWGEDGD